MGHEEKFDYDSVKPNTSQTVGYSPEFGANIQYYNSGDNRGDVFPITPCCNRGIKETEGGVFCKGCWEQVDDRFESASESTDSLREKLHPSNIIKGLFGELTPPKPLSPKDQARVDQQNAERKEEARKFNAKFYAARLSGICRNCSTLRDTLGNCGCK